MILNHDVQNMNRNNLCYDSDKQAGEIHEYNLQQEFYIEKTLKVALKRNRKHRIHKKLSILQIITTKRRQPTRQS